MLTLKIQFIETFILLTAMVSNQKISVFMFRSFHFVFRKKIIPIDSLTLILLYKNHTIHFNQNAFVEHLNEKNIESSFSWSKISQNSRSVSFSRLFVSLSHVLWFYFFLLVFVFCDWFYYTVAKIHRIDLLMRGTNTNSDIIRLKVSTYVWGVSEQSKLEQKFCIQTHFVTVWQTKQWSTRMNKDIRQQPIVINTKQVDIVCHHDFCCC